MAVPEMTEVKEDPSSLGVVITLDHVLKQLIITVITINLISVRPHSQITGRRSTVVELNKILTPSCCSSSSRSEIVKASLWMS